MAAKPLTDALAQQALDLQAELGSGTAAANHLKISYNTFRSRVQVAQSRSLRPNVTIAVAPAKEGFRVKGTSTLVDEDGKLKAQWIKTTEDQIHAQLAQEAALKVLCAKIPAIKPITAPKDQDKDLCTLYTMTDCHVGMLAWTRETGEAWDLVIAEKTLTETFLRMIASSPRSAVGIVSQLGDFLHFDSLMPLTPTSKHVLDADSRYQKVVEVAVRILERIILAALAKHDKVQVYMHEGNHDPAGSVWLRVMFAHLFRNEKRISVEQSPLPYVAFQHGNTFLAFHHGHLAKKHSLPLIFAERFAKMWGATEFRYIHCGHMHHVEEKEHPGIKVIQHPTLAAPDAYAARGGWLSKRQATSMTYHRNLGEVSRATFLPLDQA